MCSSAHNLSRSTSRRIARNKEIQIMYSTAHNTKRKTQTGIPAIDHTNPLLARIHKKRVGNGMALVSKAIEKEEPDEPPWSLEAQEIRMARCVV